MTLRREGDPMGVPADRRPRLTDRLALRPAEAARALGISERSLRQIARELPRVSRGGLVLYPVEGLREWLRREAQVEGDRINVAVHAALDRLSDEKQQRK